MFDVREPNATQADLDEERQRNLAAQAEPSDVPMEARMPYIEERPGETESTDKVDLFKGAPIVEPRAPITEEQSRKHRILMDTLDEEGERQQEERHQAQIDDDYYHHLQWTPEEARVLMDRGQAPLVYNESRAAIDWLCGTERRLRKDYKIRPREQSDERGAELKTKVFKFVDDVNLAPWHRSLAAKQMFTSGLGWLEENINPDPDRELIYSASEDWRRVMRDSRGRHFGCDDWRYQFRRVITDVDYACAIMPQCSNHFISVAGRHGTDEDDEAEDTWYLGQRLTAAHDLGFMNPGESLFGDDYTVRRIGTVRDRGRRSAVELIESWYRVPERVKVFSGGPFRGKVVNATDPRHAQAINDRHAIYEAVKMRMRVMVGTKYQPCFDGVSPFNHGRFPLVPMWGYRRGRDGLAYGAMRGMRDPQDDLNKRRSKALYALSARVTVVRKGAVEDPEAVRDEVARVDALIEVDGDVESSFKSDAAMTQQQFNGNMELAQADIEHIRNLGGVTGESLGHETNAQSGKAIIAKQEQGSMVTYELFDNYFLAFKIAGQIRMANIEQFCNQEWTFRIDPAGNRPAEWVTVNKLDPRTGQYVDDITAAQADFIVDQQDYRATLAQAAMQSMFELLGQLATFAPQVVLNLLDLAVEGADVPNATEWVNRIRKMTGQRDPSKTPTPEELQAEQDQAAKNQLMEQITIGTAKAKMDEILAKIDKSNADKVVANLTALLSAIEAAATVVSMPGIAAPADELAKSGGFKDQNGGELVTAPPEAQMPALQAPSADAPPAPGAGVDNLTPVAG